MLNPEEILFMGVGKSSLLWYRCALPAIHLGADWVGVRGFPPGVQVLTGLVRGETRLPHYANYKVIVLQQPYGRRWLAQIKALRARGIKVLYECDDYLHGVAKQPHHDYAAHFTKPRLAAHEICMRACDGMICSTEYIARRYARFNPNVFVCRNGIDVARYRLTRPQRSTTNVLFAGATGHLPVLLPWLNEVLGVMRERSDVCFISVGEPGVAVTINRLLGEGRAIGIPFCPIECYPAAMTLGDIALAPASQSAWYRGKSDLRWLEASALGMATIADPVVYPEIKHGVSGFHAHTLEGVTAALWTLLEDPERRARIGANARAHVYEHRTSETMAMQWQEVCHAVVGEYESMHQLARP